MVFKITWQNKTTHRALDQLSPRCVAANETLPVVVTLDLTCLRFLLVLTNSHCRQSDVKETFGVRHLCGDVAVSNRTTAAELCITTLLGGPISPAKSYQHGTLLWALTFT